MTQQTFKHGEDTYVVSAMTSFQLTLSFGFMVDTLRERNGKDVSWDETSPSLRTLIAYFINWNLCTRINDVAFKPLDDISADRFNEWANLITTDNDLAEKWSQAYKAANMEQTDPNALNEEPDSENEL